MKTILVIIVLVTLAGCTNLPRMFEIGCKGKAASNQTDVNDRDKVARNERER